MSLTNCPSCNNPVPPGAVFCDNCGFDLRSAASAGAGGVPATQLAAAPAGGFPCPTCGHLNVEGSAFCENCGAKLGPAIPSAPKPAAPMPVAPPEPAPPVAPVGETVAGRLVIQGANVSLPIPQGKATINIGREDPVSGIFPEIDLDPYGGQEAGVGRRHAQMTVKGGQTFIEDLDSVNGTVVNRQRIPPRKPHPIANGDEIRFGKMVLVYYAS